MAAESPESQQPFSFPAKQRREPRILFCSAHSSPRLILLAAGRWRYSEPHSAPLRFPFRGRSPARSAAEKAPAATVPQLPRPLPSAGPRFAGLPVGPAPAMATKKGGSRLETEIERCRSECQWERIPELVKQLSAKLIANGAARWVGRDSGGVGGVKRKPVRQP